MKRTRFLSKWRRPKTKWCDKCGKKNSIENSDLCISCVNEKLTVNRALQPGPTEIRHEWIRWTSDQTSQAVRDMAVYGEAFIGVDPARGLTVMPPTQWVRWIDGTWKNAEE